ncbi:MAG: hypothetical protein ACOYXC_08570 [Candidatus Rifleibacteriota bacterium]
MRKLFTRAAFFTLCMLFFLVNASAQTIIVDDSSKDCKLEGVWADNKSNGYSGGGTIGNVFHYTSKYPPFKKTGREKAIYTPNLPEDGNYKVEVSWRATENRTSKATYEVKFDGGSKKFTIDQREGKDMTWKTLGVFPFKAGKQSAVAFISDGGGSAAVDAVRFSLSKGSSTFGDVLDGENSDDASSSENALIKLNNDNPGQKSVTVKEDCEIKAEVLLSTYGNASIKVTVSGKEWIEWDRRDDKDPSQCRVDGKEISESMFEQKPGDFSPKKVQATRKVSAGDKIEASLNGDFGGAESFIIIRP